MTTRRKLLRTASGAVAAGVVGGALLNTNQEVAAQRNSELSSHTATDMCLVTVDGTVQGKFDPETSLIRWKNAFVGLGYFYQVGLPQNTTGGPASGRLQHQPVTITKLWGPASPQLLQALVTNELLRTVRIEYVIFLEVETLVRNEILLTNAAVIDVEQYQNFNASRHQNAHDPQLLEDVTFSYQTITFTNFPEQEDKRVVTYDWKR